MPCFFNLLSANVPPKTRSGKMKFRLFGGLDCPDTVLAQLSIVANMPTALLSKMVDHVTTIILLFSKAQQDSSANDSSTAPSSSASELEVQNEIFFASADFKELQRMDVAQALTALHTIISNIIRFNVPNDAAVNEMSMLGLAAEAADVIAAGCGGFSAQLRQALLDRTPLINAVSQPQATVLSRTHVELAEAEDGSRQLVEVEGTRSLVVQLTLAQQQLGSSAGGRNLVLTLTPDKCRALLSELIIARQIVKDQNVLSRD